MPTQPQYAVQMGSITKTFPGGVVANYKIDLDVRMEEVHGLLGENGAGKTTLMSILSGLYQPDEGRINVKGRKAKFKSPQDAARAGVGMVHQTFSLVPHFSVAENITLGLKSPLSLIRLEDVKREVHELCKKHGLEADPDAIIGELPVGIQQRVEILKLLYRGADILIFDEPTSVLTTEEIPQLMKTLRGLTGMGKAVIFITHKLNEAMAVCDRVTVLRRGRKVATLKPTSVSELAKLMIGEEKLPEVRRAPTKMGPIVLELRNVCAYNKSRLLLLKNVSLQVNSGRIFGIAGVEGNGQEVLVECITGLREISSGEMFIDGLKVTKSATGGVHRQRISCIPFDKHEVGIAPELTLEENAILRDFHSPRFTKDSRRMLISYSEAESFARTIVKELEVVTRGLNAPTRTLSGGNICKLVVGREILRESRLLIAANPTAGLDFRTTNLIFNELLKKTREGLAILLISTDIDEILGLSDRIAVIYRGEIMGELPKEEADIRTVGMMMGGVRLEDIERN